MDLSVWQWIALIGSGLLNGMHKTGLNGLSMVAIPVMAAAFGAKVSSGIVLPMFIVGDVIAVLYYRQHAQLKVLFQSLPWVFLGVGIGVLVGDAVSDETFGRLISASIIIGLGFTAYQEFSRRDVVVPKGWLVAAFIGTITGFSSMVGNAALLMSLYLVALGFNKREIIGTIAWLFLTVNLIKIPFHVFVWNTITWETMFLDALAVPAILVGAVLGLYLIRFIPERSYRLFLMTTVGLAAIQLMI
ncbi:MAG: sulfite exporter TauE/SafE family protein [Spirochaetales bacterium]|nr:sulfite exporter TauE/SafE family protein [Spirochaetales bacterium]